MGCFFSLHNIFCNRNISKRNILLSLNSGSYRISNLSNRLFYFCYDCLSSNNCNRKNFGLCFCYNCFNNITSSFVRFYFCNFATPILINYESAYSDWISFCKTKSFSIYQSVHNSLNDLSKYPRHSLWQIFSLPQSYIGSVYRIEA